MHETAGVIHVRRYQTDVGTPRRRCRCPLLMLTIRAQTGSTPGPDRVQRGSPASCLADTSCRSPAASHRHRRCRPCCAGRCRRSTADQRPEGPGATIARTRETRPDGHMRPCRHRPGSIIRPSCRVSRQSSRRLVPRCPILPAPPAPSRGRRPSVPPVDRERSPASGSRRCRRSRPGARPAGRHTGPDRRGRSCR
jgi:hypothetical protein